MTCCDNMPMPKVDVTCKNCWWRGRRHPDHWEGLDCPHCGEHVVYGFVRRKPVKIGDKT